MDADKIRARAEAKLVRAKKGHARRLRAKLGLDAAETAAPAPAPKRKKRAKKATKKD
jgi:hypothetical protein